MIDLETARRSLETEKDPGPLIERLRNGSPLTAEWCTWLADMLDTKTTTDVRLIARRRKPGAPPKSLYNSDRDTQIVLAFLNARESGEKYEVAAIAVGEQFDLSPPHIKKILKKFDFLK